MIEYWFKISDGSNENCILRTIYAKLLDDVQLLIGHHKSRFHEVRRLIKILTTSYIETA